MRNEDMRPTPPEMDFTIDDILDVIDDEATEDFEIMAAISAKTPGVCMLSEFPCNIVLNASIPIPRPVIRRTIARTIAATHSRRSCP